MDKTYKLKKSILRILVILIVALIVVMVFSKSEMVFAVSFGIALTMFVSTFTIYQASGKVRIDDEGMTVGGKLYFDFRNSIKWNQIGAIKYRPYLLFNTVRICPLGSKWATQAGSIYISSLIQNYPDLLKEIIMRTYDETKVDDEVVKLAKINKEELGNRKSTTYIRVVG